MEIDIKSKISKGSFGTVFKVTSKTSKNFALKVVPHQRGYIKNILELILYFSSSPYLVQAHSYEVNKTAYHILMPLAKYNLFDLIKKNKLSSEQIPFIAYNICLGVEYLHRHRIVHGDIKPTNILMYCEKNKLVPKLTDFSLSSLCIDYVKGRAYTLGFQPPENLQSNIYSFSSDIWALGQTLKMLIGSTNDMSMNLINQMLNPDPIKRPTIYEVLNNPYFYRVTKDNIIKDLLPVENIHIVNNNVTKIKRLNIETLIEVLPSSIETIKESLLFN